MDFSKILFHPSQLGRLWTEPKDKASREAGELSATSKTYLAEVYAQHKYGRKKELDNKYINRGKKCEEDSILLLSEFKQEYFEKNEQVFSNEILTGTPDCLSDDGETLYDVKTSFDIFTFLSNVDSKLEPSYELQIQAYLWLTGRKYGYVAYCLVNASQDEIEAQKQYLIRKIGAISEESPEFIKEWKEKEKLFLYQDIDEQERILLFKVEKDLDFPEKCAAKVEKAREFLQYFENKHKTFNQ